MRLSCYGATALLVCIVSGASAFAPAPSAQRLPFTGRKAALHSVPCRPRPAAGSSTSSSRRGRRSLLSMDAAKGLHNLVGSTCREVVASSVALTFLYRRDAWSSLYVCGGILNAVLSKVLKRVINESRPEGARSKDPGMPSSHAQSLFFLGTFVACGIQRWPALPISGRRAAGAAILSYATSASVWRIGAGYHTKEQIGVGAVVGTVAGLSWFALCQRRLLDVATKALAPTGGKVPVPMVVGVMCLGAGAVGSVERKISAWWSARKEKKGV